MAALSTTSLSASLLEENDIPGASLCGRKPSELKNDELKFWLKCRGDPAKGLKTEIAFFSFVSMRVTLIFSVANIRHAKAFLFISQSGRVHHAWKR